MGPARPGRGPGGPMTDAAFSLYILGARSGDREALEAIARGRYDPLYSLARRVVRGPGGAQDATQEALLRAWRDFPRLREVDRFDAWLTRMLVHACYDLLRRRRRGTAMVPWIVPTATTSDASTAF